MKNKITLLIAFILLTYHSTFAQQTETTKKQILIKNANIFDGVNEKLIIGTDVLIEGKLIKKNRKKPTDERCHND